MRAWITRIHQFAGRAFFPVLFGLLLIGSVSGVVATKAHRETRELTEKLDRVLSDLSDTRKENERLLMLIQTIEESDRLTERVAREDAHLVKPGEIVLIFPHK